MKLIKRTKDEQISYLQTQLIELVVNKQLQDKDIQNIKEMHILNVEMTHTK